MVTSAQATALLLASAAAAAPLSQTVDAREPFSLLGAASGAAGGVNGAIKAFEFLQDKGLFDRELDAREPLSLLGAASGAAGGVNGAIKAFEFLQENGIFDRELNAREPLSLPSFTGSQILGGAAGAASGINGALKAFDFLKEKGLFDRELDERQVMPDVANGMNDLINSIKDKLNIFGRELEERKFNLGTAANVAGLASAGLGIGNFISGLFQRDVSPAELEILAAFMTPEAKRELEERKFNLGTAANVAGLASAGLGIGNFIGGLFGGEKRELSPVDLEIISALMTPQAKRELEERKFNLGTAANVAGLASAGLGIGNFIGGLFQRDVSPAELEILAALMTPEAKRELEERKFNLGTAANVAGLASAGLGIGNFIGGLFQRDVSPAELEILAALMAPEAKRELEERKFNLGTAANVAGLASAGLGIGNFIGGLFQRDVSPAELEILAALMTPEAKRELDARQSSTAAVGAGLSQVADSIREKFPFLSIFGRELD